MKIDISDSVIMSAGLDKVQEGEYFDALCLFARVDSYESLLNQIGCLCALHDVGYAIELYRMLLARYAFSHNCYADLRGLGDATEIIMAYFGNQPKGEFATSSESRISANEELLGFYPIEFDDDFFDAEDFDYITALNETLNEQHRSVFYDVNSPEYFASVKRRMEKAYLEGNLAKGRALQREFLDIQTDDVATIEMQMFVCFTQQQWEAGVQYALRIVNAEGATYRGMGVAVHILARADGYNEQLQHLLVRLSAYGEEIADYDMMDYLQIATVKLGYNELTLALCNILYSHYKDAGCSALKLCARVFYNCSERERARESLLTLLRAVSWDGVAQTMLTYFNNGVALPLDDPSGYNSLARHFDTPSQLSVVAQYKLFKAMEKADYRLNKSDFAYIDCLLKVCGSCIVKGNGDKFVAEGSMLSAIVNSFTPSSKEDYVTFAKQCLLGVIVEPSISKDFLCKLILLGYRDKVLISLTQGFYALNLSKLAQVEQQFAEVLSLCATLRKVEVKRLYKAYNQLKGAMVLPNECNADTTRQVAYAVLSMSYKNFATSTEGAYFVDEEHELYLKYLSTVSQ